jgi:hypothetical protein
MFGFVTGCGQRQIEEPHNMHSDRSLPVPSYKFTVKPPRARNPATLSILEAAVPTW